MKHNAGFTCPCRRYMTLLERGGYDICPVYFWEDNGADTPDQYSSPSHMALGEAQHNFEVFGACEEAAPSCS